MTLLTVVSAGLRSPSSTRLLADQLTQEAQRGFGPDLDVRQIEVRDHAHPIADALLSGFPAGGLKRAVGEVTGADALIVVTPTFQASYSGLFKSFLDLIEAPGLRGVPVLLAATGGTERHSGHRTRDEAAVHLPRGGDGAHRGVRGHLGLRRDRRPALAARIERPVAELVRLAAGGRPDRADAYGVVPFAQLLAEVEPE